LTDIEIGISTFFFMSKLKKISSLNQFLKTCIANVTIHGRK